MAKACYSRELLTSQNIDFIHGSVALPRGAEGWSAMCDGGISWSYSFVLTLYAKIKFSRKFLNLHCNS